MINKKIAVFASAAIVAGFFLLSRGTLLLVTAQAEPNFDQSKLVGISVQDDKVLYTNMNISNIAPGDSDHDYIVVKNTGSVTEMVTITTTPTGVIFADNGKTGNSLGTDVDPNENNTVHGISMDYAAYGNDNMFKFDNHPMQISYDIDVHGLFGSVTPIHVGPFSSEDVSNQFQLGAGDSATVTYYYEMPIHAHNDYQATLGQLDIALMATGNYTPPPPPENNTPTNNTPQPPDNNTPTNNTPQPPDNNTTNTPPTPPPKTGPGNGGGVPGGTTPVTGLPIISIVLEGLLTVILGGALIMLSRGKSNES
jgi:hypothetical protein